MGNEEYPKPKYLDQAMGDEVYLCKPWSRAKNHWQSGLCGKPPLPKVALQPHDDASTLHSEELCVPPDFLGRERGKAKRGPRSGEGLQRGVEIATTYQFSGFEIGFCLYKNFNYFNLVVVRSVM